MRTKNPNTIGENVMKYRRKCGYTPRRLAEICELDVELIRSIELGRIIPAPEVVETLATALRELPAAIYGLKPAAKGEPYTRIVREGKRMTLYVEWGDKWEMRRGDFLPYDGGIILTLEEVEK